MSARTGMLFVIAVAVLGCPKWVVADDPPALSEEAKKAIVREFDEAEKPLDREFVRCPECRGTGKVKEKRCPQCLGDRKVYDGEYQMLLEGYVAYCDLMEKHEAALATDKAWRKGVEDNRLRYLHGVRAQIGPQTHEQRVSRGWTAEMRRGGNQLDGRGDVLAIEAIEAEKLPVGRGIAFEGQITSLIEKDGQKLAKVRVQIKTSVPRTCHVPVPADVRWREYADVQIIGRIVDGGAERKMFGLEDDAIVVKPYFGTR